MGRRAYLTDLSDAEYTCIAPHPPHCVPATTHWRFLDELRRIAPRAEVRGGVRYADAGKLLS